MKNKIIILLTCFLIGCSKAPTELDLLNKKNPEGGYGEKFFFTDVKNVTEILSSPETFIGKEVMISGVISDVCPMRGCWIELIDDKTSLSIRAKVTDGEIVFPLSSKERTVTVKGIFTKLELSKKQAVNWKIHLAEEKGITLNPDSVILQPKDLYEFRLNCSGAQIL